VGVLAPNTLLSESSFLGQVGSLRPALPHFQVLTTVRPTHDRFTAQRRWCLVPMAVSTAGRLTAGSLQLTVPRARWVPPLNGRMYAVLAFSNTDSPRYLKREHWANVRGRPLGLEFDKNGDLIVAEALKGLPSTHPFIRQKAHMNANLRASAPARSVARQLDQRSDHHPVALC
jgi:hypothetical protein